MAHKSARRASSPVGKSLAALHPHLVREWDAAANGPLRPDRMKATYDKAVGWIRPEDPEHPPYRMSPFTREEAGRLLAVSAAREAASVRAA